MEASGAPWSENREFGCVTGAGVIAPPGLKSREWAKQFCRKTFIKWKLHIRRGHTHSERLQMCLPEVYWHNVFHVLFGSVAGLPLLEGRHIPKLSWNGLGISENWVATPMLALHGLHGICRGAGGQVFQLVPCAVWGTFPKSDYFSCCSYCSSRFCLLLEKYGSRLLPWRHLFG